MLIDLNVKSVLQNVNHTRFRYRECHDFKKWSDVMWAKGLQFCSLENIEIHFNLLVFDGKQNPTNSLEAIDRIGLWCVYILVYDTIKIVHPLKRSKEMSHNIILRIRFCILCISKAESIETKHNMLIDYFQMLTKFTIECTSGTMCLVWHESHPLKHIRMVCARDFAIIFRTFGTIISSFAMLSHAI